MLPPDTAEFAGGIFDDLVLNVFDVTLVEFTWLAVFEDHEVGIFFCGEGKTGENFQGGTGYTT
jgi:hypothetical protein